MTEQEKKQRIAELREELKELQATPRSDWHTAFEAFLRLKTYKYKGITIRGEVEIGVDAPRTDYVILTEDVTQEFDEEIFKIFRKINILEYKNPHDSLNERVIYKIAGYANLLIGTAEHEGDVPVDQVTVSIFRSVKNPALFTQMEAVGELVKTQVPGIYHVKGITKFPFQIVITGELEGEEYATCRALTDKANVTDVELVIEEGDKEENETLKDYYRILLELFAAKNPVVFDEIRRDDEMKSALMEILKDDVDERVQETQVINIRNLMHNLKLSLEQAMDALSIPQSQRDTYANLVQKNM